LCYEGGVSRLQGKVCVVTGASAGIGEAIAEAFAAEGGAVVGVARRFEERAPEPVAGAVSRVHLDVSNEPEVINLFEAIGGVDVLVNNAGVSHFGAFDQMLLAELRAMLDTHVVGSYLCAREALRSMKSNRSGHIVTVGSTAVLDTFTESSGYTAAKAAQVAMSRVLREEARGYDVRVTDLIPGAVDTPIWDGRDGFDRAKMLQPADVAAAVVDIIARPSVSVDQIILRPPAGNL
jgi:NADP-dependent 3-hydroxy acid dehydrogenase YdfG